MVGHCAVLLGSKMKYPLRRSAHKPLPGPGKCIPSSQSQHSTGHSKEDKTMKKNQL